MGKINKQEIEMEETAKKFLFILGWIVLTLIVAFSLITVEYPKMVELSMMGFTISIGCILWKIFIKKEKKQ